MKTVNKSFKKWKQPNTWNKLNKLKIWKKRKIKNVKKVKYNLGIPELNHVSPEAKNLISNMMMYDPNKRISADEALQHNWIKLYDQSEHD